MVFSAARGWCGAARWIGPHARGEPFMRTHHTQKLDRRPPPPPTGGPFSRTVPLLYYCREKDSISAAMCPGMFPYLLRPRIYIIYIYTSCRPDFTQLRYIWVCVNVCVWVGGCASVEGEIAYIYSLYSPPPEQYHRRSTRMKNVVNIVRVCAAAATVQQQQHW